MNKTYITNPSENFAVRENQVSDYHPQLCYHMGGTHCAYGWSRNRHGDWDDAQWEAYKRGYDQYAAELKEKS